MNEPNQEKLPRDVHELLLTGDEESGRTHGEEPILDARRPKREKFFTVPVIVIAVTVVLSLIGMGIIYASPVLSEQFSATILLYF